MKVKLLVTGLVIATGVVLALVVPSPGPKVTIQGNVTPTAAATVSPEPSVGPESTPDVSNPPLPTATHQSGTVAPQVAPTATPASTPAPTVEPTPAPTPGPLTYCYPTHKGDPFQVCEYRFYDGSRISCDVYTVPIHREVCRPKQ